MNSQLETLKPGDRIVILDGHPYAGRRAVVKEVGQINQFDRVVEGALVDAGLAGPLVLKPGEFRVDESPAFPYAPALTPDAEVFDATGKGDVEIEAAFAAGAIVISGDAPANIEDVLQPVMGPKREAMTLRNGKFDDRFVNFARSAAYSLENVKSGVELARRRLAAGFSLEDAEEQVALLAKHAESARLDADRAVGHEIVNAHFKGATHAREQIILATSHAERAEALVVELVDLITAERRKLNEKADAALVESIALVGTLTRVPGGFGAVMSDPGAPESPIESRGVSPAECLGRLILNAMSAFDGAPVSLDVTIDSQIPSARPYKVTIADVRKVFIE